MSHSYIAALYAQMPEQSEWTNNNTDLQMQYFVRTLSQAIFQSGRSISTIAPSFATPIIVSEASGSRISGEKPVIVYTPESETDEIDSIFLKDQPHIADIQILSARQEIFNHPMLRGDYLIALGGCRDDELIYELIDEALYNKIPTFLINGSGGEVDSYIDRHDISKLIPDLNNGLTHQQNEMLLYGIDIEYGKDFLHEHILDFSNKIQNRQIDHQIPDALS